MKKNKYEKQFLEELSKVPIIQFACEKTGLSRQTVYRWRKEDKEFVKKMDKATEDGIAFVNDMSESQLLTMIKQGKYPAVRLWLTNNHSRYTNKLHITKTEEKKELTEDQKSTIKEALSLSINNKDKNE
jgi:hypothetical protein